MSGALLMPPRPKLPAEGPASIRPDLTYTVTIQVHAPLGLRRALGDRAADPGGHVRGDQLKRFAALFTEHVEEREHPGGRPYEAAAVVMDHNGQVPVPLAMRDLSPRASD